ncbi:hypothetical protein GJ744_006002 [Endocarpon pusillum]|uniref:Uncharacterized protein n=1 Tax=Endocarpon pusillum TaxID=364733 RepID=A0A8H7DZC3_9EURO|nr:hypothetical protein GJ744_006002 [Endocarpon pusillum]
MAVTRRQQRELVRNKSRLLRTQPVPKTPSTIRTSRRKMQQPIMGCKTDVGGEIESSDNNSVGLDQRTRDRPAIRSNFEASSRLLSDDSRGAYDTPEVLPALNTHTIISPRFPSAPPQPKPLVHKTEEKKGDTSTKTHCTSGITEETIVHDPDEVGIPNEGNWEIVAAYESRFCFKHGQREWLLRTADRWMRPSDFIGEVKEKLESKLHKYWGEPYSLEPKLLDSPAECHSNLWSHLDTPTQRGRLEDEIVYLCRWKLCWTPEAMIGDKSWVQASCKARDQSIGRRRSSRIEETTADRTAKMKQMMVVVNLEDLL